MKCRKTKIAIVLFAVLFLILLSAAGCKKKDSKRLNSIGAESSENSSYLYSDTFDEKSGIDEVDSAEDTFEEDKNEKNSASSDTVSKPAGSSERNYLREDSADGNDKLSGNDKNSGEIESSANSRSEDPNNKSDGEYSKRY